MRKHLFSSLWARKRRLLGGAIAVVIGVAFLAATLVLGDAMKGGIHSLFAEGNSGTDALVRSELEIGTADMSTQVDGRREPRRRELAAQSRRRVGAAGGRRRRPAVRRRTAS